MNIEERKKRIKHILIDKNLSFRAWCTLMGVSHSVARDFVTGRLTGTKSDKHLHVRNILKKDFGEDLFG
jgi:hypothetical protein